MVILQFTGLSGAGKSTIAENVKNELVIRKLRVEVIDGDEYRQNLCRDLGFSEKDRKENIRRLGFVAKQMAKHNIVVIIAAINPYESSRKALRLGEENVKTVWIKCGLDTLIKRDTKGLYKRALLEDTDPEKLHDLSGINDVYEEPVSPDLIISTDHESVDESVKKVMHFILLHINQAKNENGTGS